MSRKNKNEIEFTNFTPQQVAYLELHKLYGVMSTLNEKLAIMEMPCSVIDAMAVALGEIAIAKKAMFKTMHGEDDTYTD
jgi:hypothetical protein